MPTYLIGTENGLLAAPIFRRIAAAIPGAQEELAAGHMAPITHAADVGNAISGFLERSAI